MQRTIFGEEHEAFRDTVRRFMVAEVAPNRDKYRKAGMVDRELYRLAGGLGLLCTWADEAYGGAGIDDFRFEQIIIEENASSGDVGFYINLHSNIVAPYIAKLGSEEQKVRWLPGLVSGELIGAVAMTEPGTGSDLAGMRTRAEDKGDHWLLNGAKTYISNGILGDLIVVAARTDPERPHGVGLFVVERDMPGFERGRRLEKMGMKSQDTAELFFNDVKVPKANLLGESDKGFKYLARFLAQERLVVAIGSVAAAQAAFALTLEYVKERKAFGRAIGTFQNSRFAMARMRAEIDMAQTYVDQCVMLHINGQLSSEDASGAKLLGTELEGRVLDQCVQLHGGAGYMEEYRISRMYTDARITRIFAGTSEIMLEIIGRSLGLDDRGI